MYTDEELHKMCDAAVSRGDPLMALAIIAVAVAHEHGQDEKLHDLLDMYSARFLHTEKEQEGQHGQFDLTRIDPDAVIQL